MRHHSPWDTEDIACMLGLYASSIINGYLKILISPFDTWSSIICYCEFCTKELFDINAGMWLGFCASAWPWLFVTLKFSCQMCVVDVFPYLFIFFYCVCGTDISCFYLMYRDIFCFHSNSQVDIFISACAWNSNMPKFPLQGTQCW